MDIDRASAALLIGLLLDHGQSMIYPPAWLCTVRGRLSWQGKTDAKDTFVIADQARRARRSWRAAAG